MAGEDGSQTIPYKSKIAYELVFLEAIKDARGQRVRDPGRGFPNATKALELVLLPKEKKEIDKYILDNRAMRVSEKRLRKMLRA